MILCCLDVDSSPERETWFGILISSFQRCCEGEGERVGGGEESREGGQWWGGGEERHPSHQVGAYLVVKWCLVCQWVGAEREMGNNIIQAHVMVLVGVGVVGRWKSQMPFAKFWGEDRSHGNFIRGTREGFSKPLAQGRMALNGKWLDGLVVVKGS